MANGNGLSVQQRRRAQPHAEPSLPLLLAAAAGVAGGWYLLHRGGGAPAAHHAIASQVSINDISPGGASRQGMLSNFGLVFVGREFIPEVPEGVLTPLSGWMFGLTSASGARNDEAYVSIWGPWPAGAMSGGVDVSGRYGLGVVAVTVNQLDVAYKSALLFSIPTGCGCGPATFVDP